MCNANKFAQDGTLIKRKNSPTSGQEQTAEGGGIAIYKRGKGGYPSPIASHL